MPPRLQLPREIRMRTGDLQIVHHLRAGINLHRQHHQRLQVPVADRITRHQRARLAPASTRDEQRMRRRYAHPAHLAGRVFQRQPQNLARLPPHHRRHGEHTRHAGILVARDHKVAFTQGFNRHRTVRRQDLRALGEREIRRRKGQRLDQQIALAPAPATAARRPDLGAAAGQLYIIAATNIS